MWIVPLHPCWPRQDRLGDPREGADSHLLLNGFAQDLRPFYPDARPVAPASQVGTVVVCHLGPSGGSEGGAAGHAAPGITLISGAAGHAGGQLQAHGHGAAGGAAGAGGAGGAGVAGGAVGGACGSAARTNRRAFPAAVIPAAAASAAVVPSFEAAADGDDAGENAGVSARVAIAVACSSVVAGLTRGSSDDDGGGGGGNTKAAASVALVEATSAAALAAAGKETGAAALSPLVRRLGELEAEGAALEVRFCCSNSSHAPLRLPVSCWEWEQISHDASLSALHCCCRPCTWSSSAAAMQTDELRRKSALRYAQQRAMMPAERTGAPALPTGLYTTIEPVTLSEKAAGSEFRHRSICLGHFKS